MTLHNAPEDLEVRRIARLLAVDPAALEGLQAAPLVDLRTLRDQIAAKLFDEGADSWHKAAAVSGVVPPGLAAKLAQGALGPVLAARVTASVDPRRAADIAARMPAQFMADVAENIDPRQVTDLVVHLPPRTIAEVGAVLAHREEWLVMADFVAAISPSALVPTVASLQERSILLVAVLLEDPDRISEVIGLLDDPRLQALRRVAEADGLDEHLAVIVDAIDDEQRARLATA